MQIRKGQPSAKLSRDQFKEEFTKSFFDPNFNSLRTEIAAIEEQAWLNYSDSRKAPITVKAGAGYADPNYDLSVEWVQTKRHLDEAQEKWKNGPTRILIINASPRSEHTCPGEISKSFRFTQEAIKTITAENVEYEFLDLSRLTSEYGKKIYPCKACVSTAMPLCHWPCSCYPNNSLGQTSDWMAEIYESWVKAHGILIVTPVHWYQAPSVLKLMIDRMVCADGGNTDPSSTHGKDPKAAKKIELEGWDYPKHLKGRACAVIVHGDTVGAETVRRQLTDWLSDLELVPAGPRGSIDGYIGYYEPYATSHDALDKDKAFQENAQITVKALLEQVALIRQPGFQVPAQSKGHPRQK